MPNIRFERTPSAGILTIDRPTVKNAIDLDTMQELESLLDQIEADVTLPSLIFTGAGHDVFISGGDLRAFQALDSYQKGFDMSLRMQRILDRLSGLEIPVMAAINGSAYGGGWEVALACDILIASKDVQFGFRQAAMGLMTGWGGAKRLVKRVGSAQAMHLLLTAKTISADQALKIGLVDLVSPKGEALSIALNMANEIAQNAPLSIRSLKRVLVLELDMSLERAADLFAKLWISEDHDEAVKAFFEKRNPKWQGK